MDVAGFDQIGGGEAPDDGHLDHENRPRAAGRPAVPQKDYSGRAMDHGFILGPGLQNMRTASMLPNKGEAIQDWLPRSPGALVSKQGDDFHPRGMAIVGGQSQNRGAKAINGRTLQSLWKRQQAHIRHTSNALIPAPPVFP